jgi:hypothetical protein
MMLLVGCDFFLLALGGDVTKDTPLPPKFSASCEDGKIFIT